MFNFKTFTIGSLIVVLAAGCSKDEPQVVSPAQPHFVPATDSRAKKPVDPINYDQVALLVARIAGESTSQQEVFKAVKNKWEGYEVVLLKHILNKKTDAGQALSFSTETSAEKLVTAYQSGAYPKTKRGKANADLLKFIKDNNLEIRWHYWQNWDGKEVPTVTFNPGVKATANVGYRFVKNGNGYTVQEVQVDDDYAFAHPTWVIDAHNDVPKSDVRSERFIPNYGQKPVNAGGRQMAPSEYLIPGPKDGTAAVNKTSIWWVRTDGQNFRDSFFGGGGWNDMYFICADEVVRVNAEGKSTQVVTIDRWAGRTGTWRWVNAEWDNNWKAGEDEQALGLVGMDLDDESTKEFSGSVSIGLNSNVTTGGANGSISNGYKKTVNFVDMLMQNRKIERRTFFASNSTNYDNFGLHDGDCIRRAGTSGRKVIYYTMRVESYNYGQ